MRQGLKRIWSGKMNSKNIMYDHYFIGFANLAGKGEVLVEHYLAADPVDCMKQCLKQPQYSSAAIF